MSDRLHAPPRWMTALESRAFGERVAMAASLPLLRQLPSGDGHHVIVLPGFSAGDESTRPLRHLLRDLGYRSHGWRLGVNVGPTEDILQGLAELLGRVHAEAQAPVSLIGWSLGGIYARELARAAPTMARQVITLGSPIQMVEQDRSGAQAMWNRVRHLHAPGFSRTVREVDRPKLTVPNTSIYSRTDGVVNWRASLVERTEHSENVRVYGSHIGLGFNPAAIYVIANRLVQPADEWRHFRAPLALAGVFPCSADLDRSRLPGAA